MWVKVVCESIKEVPDGFEVVFRFKEDKNTSITATFPTLSEYIKIGEEFTISTEKLEGAIDGFK